MLKKISTFYLIFCLTIIAIGQNPQEKNPLHGTYIIGNGEDFESLTYALSSLYANGSDSDVVFLLSDSYDFSSENYPIIITNFNGSEKNSLTIKAAEDFNSQIEINNAPAIYYFHNARNVVFDGAKEDTNSRNLTLINSFVSDTMGVFAIDSLSRDISIKNCNIYANGNNHMSSGIAGEDCSNIKIINNKIAKAQIGIIIEGDSTYIKNNEIGSSETEEFLDFGIYIKFGNSAFITGNKIYNLIDDNIYNQVFNIHAIAFSDMTGVVSVTNNFIDSLIYAGNDRVIQAIALSDCNTDSFLIANNRISHIASDAYSDNIPCAITVNSPQLTSLTIVHNSINMPRNSNYGIADSETNVLAAGLAINEGTGIIFKNNIISNKLGIRQGTSNLGVGVAIAFNSTSNPFSEIDNNLYSVDNYTLNTLAIFPNGLMDIQQWQNFTGQENRSVMTDDVHFVDDDNLHVLNSSFAVAHAQFIPSFAFDIDSIPRNPENPTIGAYEFEIIQASNLMLENYEDNFALLNWKPGNGQFKIVFMKKTDEITDLPKPKNYKSYYIGEEIDTSGWICVYNGIDTFATIHNDSGKYAFMVMEYYAYNGNEIYIKDTAYRNPILTDIPSKIKSIEKSLKIFPNPTSGIIYISGDNIKITKITIFNIQGKQLNSFTPSKFLDLSKLKSGVYIIKSETKDKVFSQKIILKK